MRRALLTVFVLSLALPVVVTTAARAATSDCRHLITDPRGDAYSWFLPTQPYNPDADLLYVDARTTRTTIDLIVTMAKVEEKPTTGTGVGIYFSITNQGATVDYMANVNHAIDGTSYSMQNDDTNAAWHITGGVDPATGTYVLHVPRARIGATYKGAWLKHLGVITSQDVGIAFGGGGFIEQSTGPLYRYHVGHASGC
jgi:hypothetical protein